MNNIQSTSNTPKKSSNASSILKDFCFPPLTLSKAEKATWKEIFFDSIITEYDARRLYWYIADQNPACISELGVFPILRAIFRLMVFR